MPYGYNRNAFRDGPNASSPVLLRTYCSLVALELGLKDFLGLSETAANAGHDLPDLLNRVKERDRRTCSSLNSIQTQLRRQLTSIRCQGRGGAAQSIPASSYPHLRYMRHESDWPSDASTDSQLHTVLSTVQKLTSSLAHYGIIV
jgi:hypothetical protein